MTTIKQKILQQNKEEDFQYQEYENLILDSFEVSSICDEDKAFLQLFVECKTLSLNQCKLKSIDNLPSLPNLEKLSFNDNFIEQIPKEIGKNLPKLTSIRIANNKIKNLQDLEPLLECQSLSCVDFTSNPIAETENYALNIREMFAKVEVVDGKDREGNSVISDEMDDEADYGDENGEEEMSEGDEDELEEMEEGEEEFSENEDQEQQPVKKVVGETETSAEGNIGESPKQRKINAEVKEPASKKQKTDS